MRRVKLMLFFLPVVLAGAVALSVIFLPGHASATPPTHTTVDLTGNFSLPTSFTGCSFVITHRRPEQATSPPSTMTRAT